MKFHTTLSEFNRRIADRVRDLFSHDVTPQQGDDGRLYFRGPSPSTGAQVVAYLESDLQWALDKMSPEGGEENEGYLIKNLATQIQTQYDPNKPRREALEAKGTVAMLQRE